MSARPLSTIAQEIAKEWPKAMEVAIVPGWGETSHPARPYIVAMSLLMDIHENYYADSGTSVVRYFLSNAGQWRGESARRIKAELKGML